MTRTKKRTVDCVVLPSKSITKLVEPRGFQRFEEGDEITLTESQYKAFKDKVRLASADPYEDPFADPLEDVNATDSAKALARQYNIDLVPLDGKGSGADRKILKADVEKMVKSAAAAAAKKDG